MAVRGEIGRSTETARLGAALERARTGLGPAVVVVRGEPGSGKSALLETCAARAAAGGFRVASVRATGSADRPYASADRLLALLGAAAPTGPAGADEIRHRLEATRVRGDAPLLLCVDDLDRLDPGSLRWLRDLSRTPPPAPLLIVVSAALPGTGSGAVTAPARGAATSPAVALLAGADLVELRGLPPHALPRAAERCRIVLGARTAAVCAELTGGNPALLHALLAPHADTTPTAAALRATAASGPLPGADRWLAGLGEPALALVRAVAVLGADAEVTDSAALAGLPVGATLAAVDELVEVCVLANRTPLTFRHPLLASMVLGRIAAGTRVALHLRAATLLRGRHAAPTTVARHLIAAGPVGEDWAVRQLRSAAHRLERDGRPEEAAHHLRGALREHLRPHERSAVHRELAEIDAFVDPERAARVLDTARQECEIPALAADYTLALAAVLTECGRADEAVSVLDETAARFERNPGAGSWQLRLRLHKEFTFRRGPLWQAATDPLGDLVLASPHRGLVGREVAALRAAREVDAGLDRAAAVRHARQGLPRGTGRVPGCSVGLLWYACGALLAAGETAEAWSLCGRGRLHAGARPSRWEHVRMELICARILRARGDLAAAEATLAPVADQLLPAAAGGLPSAVAVVAALAEVRALRGEPAAARALLAEARLDGGPLPRRRDSAYALIARAAAHEDTDPARATADLLAAGRLLEEAGVRNPAVLPWRSRAARLLVRQDQRARAAALAVAELAVARRWGTPECVGTALHAVALTETGHRRTELLDEAVAHLTRTPAALELCLARFDLGTALAGRGETDRALAELAGAAELARACGAGALLHRAREAAGRLVAPGRPDPGSAIAPAPTGAPYPGRRAATAADAPTVARTDPRLSGLTPQEQRIVHLARDGHTNRDIAGLLFLAVRTVEFHLSGAYRKLGIRGRRQLSEVFGTG
ncbi:AAA family ATPase [Streptomyces sp. NPDC051555]|uniref:helix-turn-helix transcriptional regulator n=1 Tax=Streptomyces sp. NPDC051555 TaxID=3365657 RepID=UPI0037ABD6DB